MARVSPFSSHSRLTRFPSASHIVFGCDPFTPHFGCFAVPPAHLGTDNENSAHFPQSLHTARLPRGLRARFAGPARRVLASSDRLVWWEDARRRGACGGSLLREERERGQCSSFNPRIFCAPLAAHQQPSCVRISLVAWPLSLANVYRECTQGHHQCGRFSGVEQGKSGNKVQLYMVQPPSVSCATTESTRPSVTLA